MYNYSPIQKMSVKNFRNIGSVEIDFTESPIVTLVGENEAGKTSLIKAFSMCALHDSPRDQKDYIRDNTDALGIQIDLEDGTHIIRVKQTNGLNLYRVIYPDGKVWDANKITDGLPEAVAEKMGLITEPETNEYLNVRTYEDKLPFVVTPASTNYKVMYNALKVEQLTKAIKQGSNEVNALKAKVSKNDDSVQTLNAQMRQIVVYDTEPLRNVRDRIKNQLESLDKLKKLSEKIDKLEELRTKLGALALIDLYKLEEVDVVTASRINTSIRLLENLSEKVNKRDLYNDLNSISEIDTSTLDKVNVLRDKISELNSKTQSAGALISVASMESISESVVSKITSLNSRVNKRDALMETLSKIDVSSCEEIDQTKLNAISKLNKIYSHSQMIVQRSAVLAQYNVYIEQIQNYLQQCGVAVETCPKCGESIVFDLDKMS